jgi:apolipoprotein N-acyltransferase
VVTTSDGAARRVLVRGLSALLSPLLLGVYAWFPFLVFMPYVALVPWILLYSDERAKPASVLWFVPSAWLAWMLQYPGTLNFGWFVPPAMAAAMFVPWLAFPVLMKVIHRRFLWPRTVTVPIVWVSVEWIRSACTLAHFDVYALGYSQARVTPLVQGADIVGVYGISFLVAAVNGWLADMWVARRDAPLGGADSRTRRRVARLAIGLVALFAVAIAYGAMRLATADNEIGPRVALVQPNVLHNERNALGVHLAQVIYTDEHVQPSTVDLIVWPENAVLDDLRRPGVYLPDLARLARVKQASLLVGAMGKSREAPGRTTNSAFLVDASGGILGESRKRILFPWSETMPADAFLRRFAPPLWRFQRALVRAGWGFVPAGLAGSQTAILDLPWNGGSVPFAVLICVENAYPPLPAEATRRGARFLVNITSEREIGGPIQEQLLRVSMLRAVENRLAYVRCGNSGVSAFIDPQGRVRSVLRGERGGTIFDRGVLADRVLMGAAGATLYARSHDAFALCCLVTTLALFAAALFGGRGVVRGLGVPAALVLLAVPGCRATDRWNGDPAAARAMLSEGRARMRRGDFDGAVPPLTTACALPGPCREAIPVLVHSFRATRRYEDAVDLFTALAAAKPDVLAESRVARAGFLERLQELPEAERDLVEAARIEPKAETFAALGTLRLRMERPAEALDAYARASQLAPDDQQIHYLHARALWVSGRSAEAESELDALLANATDLGGAWVLKGRLREADSDEPGAVAAFHAALRVDPGNVEARFLLARRALATGDLDQAKLWLAEIGNLDVRGASSRRGAGEKER